MTNCYVVSYDIHDSEEHKELYSQVEEYLLSLSGHRALDNVWLISTTKSTKEILSKLKEILGEKNAIVVIKISETPQFSYPHKGTYDWLKKHNLN